MAASVVLPFPNDRPERVIVWCLTCGRRTWVASYIIEAAFGYLPFGVLTSRLRCRKGCGDNFGVVLPIDAPTPREFVNKYTAPPQPPPKVEQLATATEERLRGALVEVGKRGTFDIIHARSNETEILSWGFGYLMGKVPPGR
jgi:hypothetical protein